MFSFVGQFKVNQRAALQPQFSNLEFAEVFLNFG